MVSIHQLDKSSRVHCNEGLLFVLRELTGHSVSAIMGHFMDCAVEAIGCPSNIKTRKRDQVSGFKILVIRGFYPATPVMYKLAVFVLDADDPSPYVKPQITVYAKLVAKTNRNISKTLVDLADAAMRESLVGDTTQDKIRAPKTMTPKGATLRRYKSTKSK